MGASKTGNDLVFRGPVDPRWEPSGVFEYAATRAVPLQEIVDAARLLVGVSRLSGYSVQGLIALSLTQPALAPGEDLIGGASSER